MHHEENDFVAISSLGLHKNWNMVDREGHGSWKRHYILVQIQALSME